MGNLKFNPVAADWNLDHEGVSHGVAFADFDHDGDMDFVVNNYYEQSLIYRNNSGDGNRLMIELRAVENNTMGYGSTVEIWFGDEYRIKELNPVRGYLASDNPSLHFGLGDQSKIDRLKITWADGTTQSFADLEAGNLYRVIESPNRSPAVLPSETSPETLFAEVGESRGLNHTHADRAFDDYEREHLLPYKISELGSGIACGDINGDGFVDAFCGGASGQPGQLFISDAGKSFSVVAGPWQEHAESEDTSAILFDADGDGDLDLYVGSGSNETSRDQLIDRLYVNDGTGKFSNAAENALPELYDSTGAVAAVDFDQTATSTCLSGPVRCLENTRWFPKSIAG